MKKILILSYFYPPANFVGAQRTAAWGKYLHEFGYYPIIITRKWNDGQTDLIDQQENNELVVEYNATHEVHRLPYKRSVRDRLSNYSFLKPIQKALTLKELIFSNWSINSLPFSNFYTYSREMLKKDKEINFVMASGRPFQAFSIGCQLKKDFPSIHWIPDYRDKWSTNEAILPKNSLEKLVFNLEKKSEIKWTSNCSAFVTVSEDWSKDISNLINKPGFKSANGFDEELRVSNDDIQKSNDELNLLYMGSLYGDQNFSILFRAIQEINTQTKGVNVHVTFLGSYSNEEGLVNLKKLTKEIKNHVSLKSKVTHDKVSDYIEQSDVLILTSIENLTGILPVKSYDYYSSNKPILLCPSDYDLMENFIKETDSGYVANNVEECKTILSTLLGKKNKGEALIGSRNTKNAYFYSRKYQTKLLAKALDELLEK